MLVLAGCASSQRSARPPAASFNGTLSQQVLPASIIGPDWTMQQGLIFDDLSKPTTVPAARRKWAETFVRQRRAAGARSYGEIFYIGSGAHPNQVSTLILVYDDAAHARAHWNEAYGPGQMTMGYRRTNRFGDKSVEHGKRDEIVVLASNVVLQVSQPIAGDENEMVLNAYLHQLGLDQPASAAP